MLKLALIFLCCNFLLATADAQPLTKIFAAINAGDYSRAKKYLDKSQSENDPALAFANARYFFEPDNPDHQLDSAKTYLMRAAQHLGDVTKKSKVKRNGALGVRTYSINDLNSRINEKAFERALSFNTVDQWNYFLQNFSDAEKFGDARVRRNRLAFEQAKESNRPARLRDFFERYPDAVDAKEAHGLYDQLLYIQQTGDSTWHAYKRFMDEHPNSPYIENAKANYERLLFIDQTRSNTADAYATFIVAHPESSYRLRAEDSLYARFTKPLSTIAKLNQFIQRYPQNKNIDSAWKKLFFLSTNGSDSSIHAFVHQHVNYPQREIENDSLRSALLVKFSNNDYIGYKDSLTNRVVMPPVYWDLGDFSEGLVAATMDNCDSMNCRYGYYDRHGDNVIEPKYSEANSFHNGMAVVAVGNCSHDSCLYGMINKVGDFVVAPLYHDLSMFTNGLALVRRDSMYGFIDTAGKQIIPLRYKDANEFGENVAAVYDTAWKFINTKGQTVITGNFSNAGTFSEGLCAVASDKDVWGYIDKSGAWMIKPQFTDAGPFVNGKAKVNTPASKKSSSTKPDKERWIDKQGKFIKAEP